jgi:hypothetical protein
MNSRGILPILEMAPQTMAQDTFWKGSRPNFLFAILWNHKSETLAAELFPHQKNNIVTCKSIEELLTFLNSGNILCPRQAFVFYTLLALILLNWIVCLLISFNCPGYE